MSDSEARFEFVLKVLDSCESIGDKLNHVDQINSTLNDSFLKTMIEDASELSSLLRHHNSNAQSYKVLLEKTHELESIFDINSRLDDYIHNPTQFDLAIDCLETIDQLNRMYGHEVQIIEACHERSKRQRQYLIANICQSLERMKDPSNNEISQAVGHLIRCGNFSERDLKLKYIQARDNWFNNACEDQSSSFDHVVSVYANGLPMIFNEYKSLFGDSSGLVNKSLMPVSDPAKEDSAIINSWLLLKSSIFISSLEVYLKGISQSGVQTPTMIGDTMKKCFQLTESLALIGFDFSSQLRPLFSQALAEEVKSCIENATTRFELGFTQIISKSIESLLLPVDDEITRISNMRPDEQLPKSIENYPIFKVYFLYIIDSLRWLQATKTIWSPISLCLEVYGALNSSLNRAVKALSIILNMDNNSNHPILTNIAICLMTQVLPFLVNYCERIFPKKLILSSLGISKAEFKSICSSQPDELKNFRLDLRGVSESLRSIKPGLFQNLGI